MASRQQKAFPKEGFKRIKGEVEAPIIIVFTSCSPCPCLVPLALERLQYARGALNYG